MKIGFFDSGIGGLTVLNQAIHQLPFEHYLYFADLKNVPYGNKPRKLIQRYTFIAAEFLFKKKIDALVIACNTATAVAIDDLRQSFSIPILGMEPAVKPAIKNSGQKKVLVIATKRTIKEKKLENLVLNLGAEDKVEYLALQELVMFAENKKFESDDVISYLKDEFSKINFDEFQSIVLGCTHFLFFKKLFTELLPKHLSIIDGNEGTINNLKFKTTNLDSNNKLQIDYYASGILTEKEYFSPYLNYLQHFS